MFLDAHASLEPTMSVRVSVRLNQTLETFSLSLFLNFAQIFRMSPRFSECCKDFQNFTKIFRISSRFSEIHPDFQNFTQIFKISTRFSEFPPDFQSFIQIFRFFARFSEFHQYFQKFCKIFAYLCTVFCTCFLHWQDGWASMALASTKSTKGHMYLYHGTNTPCGQPGPDK